MIDDSEWPWLITPQSIGLLLTQHYGTWHSQERPEAHDVNIALVSPIYLRIVSGDQNLQACPLQGSVILSFPAG